MLIALPSCSICGSSACELEPCNTGRFVCAKLLDEASSALRCACNFANNLASGPSGALAASVSSELSTEALELDRRRVCLAEDRLI